MIVWHLAPALAGEHEHSRDPSIDIGPAVLARRTGLRRQLVELFLVLVEINRKRLEHVAALMKCQLAQIGTANGFRMAKNGAEVEAVAGDGRHRLAGDG